MSIYQKTPEWLLIVTSCIFIYRNFPSVTEFKILTSSLNNIKYWLEFFYRFVNLYCYIKWNTELFKEVKNIWSKLKIYVKKFPYYLGRKAVELCNGYFYVFLNCLYIHVNVYKKYIQCIVYNVYIFYMYINVYHLINFTFKITIHLGN